MKGADASARRRTEYHSAGTVAPEEKRISPSARRMIRVAEDKPRKAMTAATAMSGQ
jgi:hypothetical protein